MGASRLHPIVLLLCLAPCARALEVHISAEPRSGPAVLAVSFSARAEGGTGRGYIYFWDFDSSDGLQVDAIGDSVTYPFGSPGEYTVTVRAWDDAGDRGEGELNIEVDPPHLVPSDPVELKDVSFPVDSPCVIEGLEFTAEDSMHIYLERVENVIIRNNRFGNLKVKESIGAINVVDSRNVVVEGNLVEDCYKGIYVGGEDIEVRYNVLRRIGYEEDVQGEGIIVTRPSARVVLEGNLLRDIGPSYDVPPPGLDAPGAYIPVVSIGIGVWGASDCTVRDNFIFDVHGVNFIAEGPLTSSAGLPVQLAVVGNFVRNQLIREAGIMINDYPHVRINHNLIDYSNNFGISVSDCEDVEIGDNIVLNCVGSGINITDSKDMKVHHNTLVRDAFEELPSGETGVGIYVMERRIEPYPHGEPPFVSSDILVVDNLVDGWYQGGIFLGSGRNNYLDWNAVAKVNLKDHDQNTNSYIRAIDPTWTTVVGRNNRICVPGYIAREDKNYFLRSSDPLYSAGHDGGSVGAIWDGSYVLDLEKADIVPTRPSGNVLANPGAEEGVTHPWGLSGGTYNMSEVLFEVRSAAEVDGRAVGPYGGSSFFFVRGRPEPGEVGAIEVMHGFREIDEDLWGEIDKGACFFRLTFHVLTSDLVPEDVPGVQGDYGFDIRATFYDEEGEEGYLCSSANLRNWESTGEYRRFTLYGQVPPGSRQVGVDISLRPFKGVPEVRVAFDEVSLEFLTGVQVHAEEIESTPEGFVLHGNFPNPFNSFTTISYTLPYSTWVEAKVYDVMGREVATLLRGFQLTGHHSLVWRPDAGSGVYIYRIRAGKLEDAKKCLLLK